MNESLQQALAGILNKTMAGVEAGVSFLSAELPDVIQQLLVWKLAESCMLLTLGFAFLLTAIKLIRKGFKNLDEEQKKDWHSEKPSRYVVPFAIGGFSSTIAFILVMSNAGSALQIWLAPKIYLIEYAASLAK